MMGCDLVLERGVDKGPLKRGALSTISYSVLGNVHCLQDDHETIQTDANNSFTQASS